MVVVCDVVVGVLHMLCEDRQLLSMNAAAAMCCEVTACTGSSAKPWWFSRERKSICRLHFFRMKNNGDSSQDVAINCGYHEMARIGVEVDEDISYLLLLTPT